MAKDMSSPPFSSETTSGSQATKACDHVQPPSAPKERNKKNAKQAASLPEKLTHLVIDSGAIIKGAGMTLSAAAQSYWTVPEVLSEIRDKKARHHIDTLPFELKLREPSDEAMKFVANFARQTGDLRSLSRVDLKVIALTYMLEKQETGGSHLRISPVRPGTKTTGACGGKGKAKVTAAKAKELAAPNPVQGALPQSQIGRQNTSHKAENQGNADEASANSSGKQADNTGDEGDMAAICDGVRDAWTQRSAITEGTGTKGGGGENAISGSGDESKMEERLEQGDGGSEDKLPEIGKGESTGRGEIAEEEMEGGNTKVLKEYAKRQLDVRECAGERQKDEGEGEGEGESGEVKDWELVGEGEESDDSDDDDWEPEGGENVEPEDTMETTSSEGVFKATEEEFPALGHAVAPAKCEEASTDPATAVPIVSWTAMARSNPAPFKPVIKPDPAPLKPATSAISEPTLSGRSPGDHFNGSGDNDKQWGTGDKPVRPDGGVAGSSRILSSAAGFGVSDGGAEDDDGEGWVNPSNFKAQKAAGIGLNGPLQQQKKGKGGRRRDEQNKCRAGCVTTDFAMQNVLLQVGLQLVSLDGMAIRNVKQWILRCAACFKTCTDMGRLFCPVCGNATLDRVSCSIDAATGAMRVHLRKNHKNNLRGSKFSIPSVSPTKGRFEGDLLLREDQLLSGIWAQKARRTVKDVSSMFGEDVTLNVGLSISKSPDILVGYGRKNPNAAKGRERRGKKGSGK